MNQILDTLNHYLNSAQGVIQHYGPGVWQATLALIRLQGIFDAVGLIALTVASVVGFVKLLAWCRKFYAAGKGYHDREFSFTLLIVPGIGLIAAFICWANSLSIWLSIFSPQLEVLYQVAQKAGVM